MSKKPVIPLSENSRKRVTSERDECVADMIRIAEGLPDVSSITRRHYRMYGKFSEGAWTQHFGTFEEFKRSAGLKHGRHSRRMEMEIAKHESVNNYKTMTLEKRQYAGKYARPTGGRFQTILIGSDIHDIECDPFWYLTFLDTAKRVQPEIIVLNGDLFDLPEFGKYAVDPREFAVTARIRWVHDFLKKLRNACPNAQIDLIEGNHEYRLLRHLSEATPAMKVLLSDLHGFTVSELLGLDEFEVNYIAPADLATFTKPEANSEVKRNFKVYFDFLVAHHFPDGGNFGLPGWNGHHHSHRSFTRFNPVLGTYEWHQLGAGHKRSASYCNGEKWSNGFMLAHVDTERKRAQFEYIDVTADHAMIGGKWYERV